MSHSNLIPPSPAYLIHLSPAYLIHPSPAYLFHPSPAYLIHLSPSISSVPFCSVPTSVSVLVCPSPVELPDERHQCCVTSVIAIGSGEASKERSAKSPLFMKSDLIHFFTYFKRLLTYFFFALRAGIYFSGDIMRQLFIFYMFSFISYIGNNRIPPIQ